MSELKDERIQKTVSSNRRALAVGIILAALTIFLLVFNEFLSRIHQGSAIPFYEAYNDKRLEDDIYVYLDTYDYPYDIGYYDSSEQYYFVADDSDLYILRCTESMYNRICKAIDDEGEYRIVGTIGDVNSEVKDMAIEVYNEDETDPEYMLTESDFDSYFANKLINMETKTGMDILLIVLAVIVGIVSFGLILGGALGMHRYSRAFKKLTDEEAEELNREIESSETTYLKGCKVFLTPNYIISMGNMFVAVKYTDIVWAYKFIQRMNFVPILTNIKVHTLGQAVLSIADMAAGTHNKDDMIATIFMAISNHNPNARIGYSNGTTKHISEV